MAPKLIISVAVLVLVKEGIIDSGVIDITTSKQARPGWGDVLATRMQPKARLCCKSMCHRFGGYSKWRRRQRPYTRNRLWPQAPWTNRLWSSVFPNTPLVLSFVKMTKRTVGKSSRGQPATLKPLVDPVTPPCVIVCESAKTVSIDTIITTIFILDNCSTYSNCVLTLFLLKLCVAALFAKVGLKHRRQLLRTSDLRWI